MSAQAYFNGYAMTASESKFEELRNRSRRANLFGAAFEARDSLQEAHDLVGAQHDRQLARLTRIGDALRHRVLGERYAIEELAARRRSGSAQAMRSPLQPDEPETRAHLPGQDDQGSDQNTD